VCELLPESVCSVAPEDLENITWFAVHKVKRAVKVGPYVRRLAFDAILHVEEAGTVRAMSELINVRDRLALGIVGTYRVLELLPVLPFAPLRIELPLLEGNKHFFWSQISCFEVDRRDRLCDCASVDIEDGAGLGVC